MSEDLVRATALPAISPEQMTAALTKYKEMQKALDQAMPDQIMDLDGKKFRKKGYWRAIALAFNLQVELVAERREVSGRFQDGRDNFGWVVTYVAKHPNKREMTGDGSCFAVEKARRFKCPHPESPGSRRTIHFPHNTCPDFDPDFQWRVLPGDATEHNVRSHAHTRAFNRAVSNLVGFGEVSAEEVEREEHEPQSAGSGQTQAAAAAAEQGAVSDMTPTKVKSVDVKTGVKKTPGKPDKPWTRYDVVFADNRRGNTFSKSHGEHAIRARDTHALVVPDLRKTEHGFDLVGFIPLDKAQEARETAQSATQQGGQQQTETAHEDEPVNGPENVLVVRQVKTEHGDRFRIQTNKRELVSDLAGHADEASAAREAKRGIIPEFEVIEGKGGQRINRLIRFKVDGQDGWSSVAERTISSEPAAAETGSGDQSQQQTDAAATTPAGEKPEGGKKKGGGRKK